MLECNNTALNFIISVIHVIGFATSILSTLYMLNCFQEIQKYIYTFYQLLTLKSYEYIYIFYHLSTLNKMI